MEYGKIKIQLVLVLLIFILAVGCGNTQASGEVRAGFLEALEAYQQIWETKDRGRVEELAERAFANNELIEQILESHQASLEIDTGVKITDQRYDIRVVSIEDNQGTLKVKADLKGYPISINSGHTRVERKEDYSFGPHHFAIEKKQGVWKIANF